MNSEAGIACYRGLRKSLAEGLRGWPLVDREMQRQIEAGVTTIEAWESWLTLSELMESWNAYNADRENPDKWSIPKPKDVPIIDRWGDVRAHQEFTARLPAPVSVWDFVYHELNRMKIREPGYLLRTIGYTPQREGAIGHLLAKIQNLSPEEKARISRGDDALLLGVLEGP